VREDKERRRFVDGLREGQTESAWVVVERVRVGGFVWGFGVFGGGGGGGLVGVLGGG